MLSQYKCILYWLDDWMIYIIFCDMCVSCRDICPLLKDPAALTAVIDLFEEHVRKNYQEVELIVGKKTKQSTFLNQYTD